MPLGTYQCMFQLLFGLTLLHLATNYTYSYTAVRMKPSKP